MLKIKEMREKAGITQAKLAEISGVDARWIRKLESGEISIENITVLNMVKLLKGLSNAVDDEFIFEDFTTLKHAYIVTKLLISDD